MKKNLGRPRASYAHRAEFGGQAGVQVGQAAPVGEDPDVVRERLARAGRGPAARPALQHRLIRGDEFAGQPLGPVQVPPLAHLGGQVTEGQVIGVEQVGVPGQPQPGEHLRGRLVQVGRGDPHPGRSRAEAEVGELGPQHMTLVPLGLGHREHREQPAIPQPGPLPAEDPVIPLPQDRLPLPRQLVPRGPARAPGDQDSPPLQPGDGGTHGRLINSQVPQQADQRSDRHPPTRAPRIQPIDGHDQLPGLRRPRRYPLCRVGHGRHPHKIAPSLRQA